jgi:anti-anti-sigma regulatory factor
MRYSMQQGVTSTLVRGCLVVTLPQELADSLADIQAAVLDGVRETGSRVVVIELSAVKVLDCVEFAGIRELVGMVRLLGVRPFLVGMSPGIVAYLVNNDADTRGLEVERALEDALDRATSADQPRAVR